MTVSNLTGGNALQGVKKISAGRWHACARLENGQARCWGDNEDGQLGDGTTTNRTRPVSVSNATGGNALQNVRKISAGTWQTCAKLSNGQARCWGDNAFGALGDGTVTDRLRPVTVSNEDGTGALSVVGIISAGEYRHSCAVLDGDQARCWGYNFTGQLGDGTDHEPDATRRRPPRGLTGPPLGGPCGRLWAVRSGGQPTPRSPGVAPARAAPPSTRRASWGPRCST